MQCYFKVLQRGVGQHGLQQLWITKELISWLQLGIHELLDPRTWQATSVRYDISLDLRSFRSADPPKVYFDELNMVENIHHHYRSLGGYTYAFLGLIFHYSSQGSTNRSS